VRADTDNQQTLKKKGKTGTDECTDGDRNRCTDKNTHCHSHGHWHRHMELVKTLPTQPPTQLPTQTLLQMQKQAHACTHTHSTCPTCTSWSSASACVRTGSMSRVGPASRVSRVESMRDMFTYACMCACIHSRVSVNMQAPLYLCSRTHIVRVAH